MSLSPDQSRFSACVLGEATPAELAAFDAALLNDPVLREEAVTLRRTAHRLSAALQQETPLSLSPSQQHRVLTYVARTAAAVPRRPVRPAWIIPTFATAGIAAVLALGLYVFTSPRSPAPGSGPETGIPSIVVHPVLESGTSPGPLPPLPALSPGAPASLLPDAADWESPASVPGRGTMAATPPVIKVSPVPARAPQDPGKDAGPVAKPGSGQPGAGPSLASPAPQPPP